MDQLNLFDLEEAIPEESAAPENNLFHPEKAHWYLTEHTPISQICKVIGVIPAYVKSPTEDRIRRDYPTNEFGEMLNIWSAYVWAIAQTIPYKERDKKNDINGWLAAGDMLKNARDEKKPILLELRDYRQQDYRDLEVVEYLPEPEKSEEEKR